MKSRLLAVSLLTLLGATTTQPSPSSPSSSRSESYSRHGYRSSRSYSPSSSSSQVPTTAPSRPQTGSPHPFTDYSVLAEHNIFVKDRYAYRGSGRSGSTPSSTTQASSPQAQERVMILTGIVDEDGGYYAYVEDPPSGTVLRLSVGDDVAHGKIGEIMPDAIAYDQNGQRTWVVLGDDLTGHPADAGACTFSSSASASTMPSGVAGLSLDDPTLTMEQRMKLKRMQELQH